MISAQNPRDRTVKVGDLVSFKFPKYQCYLSAEGILVEDVFVSSDISFFEEHVFQIYVQRQYSATNELEEFLRVNGEDASAHDLPMTSHMEALLRGKDNETALNKTVMKNKIGNVVCFGDTIQLLHMKSNKFVTVNATDLARDERENMRVSLNHDGSVLSWVKILPRYKINREGEPVTIGTEVLLKVSERANEFLHCADRPPPKGRNREVNSSLDAPTGWKINVFQAAEDIANTNLLQTGQLVYIRDPESQSMLAPIVRPLSLEAIHVSSAAGAQPVTGNVWSANAGGGDSVSVDQPWKSSPNLKSMSDQDVDDCSSDQNDEDISISSFDEYVRDHGHVAFRIVKDDVISSDSLWMMESKSIVKGGFLRYKLEQVHFRHFVTGQYLSVLVNHEGNGENWILTLEPKPSEKRTLFGISELHSNEELLNNGKAVQIRHSAFGAYLERGSYYDNQRVYAGSLTRNKNRAVNLIINRYVQKEKIFLKKLSATGEEALDVYFSKAAAHHLSKYCRSISFPAAGQEMSTIWPRIDKQETQQFSTFMARITLFARGFPIRMNLRPEDLAKFNSGRHVITRRQNMLREVGVLQILIIMIKSLQPLTDLLAQDASTNKFIKSNLLEMGKEVLTESLQLVFDLVKKNTSNQLYIADHLLVILEHVSTDKLAAKVAQELLSSNRELQETKIGKREIALFTDKVRDTAMNAMYLQLLRTCCSCAGEGLPKNQETVNVVLFQKSPQALILLAVNDESPLQVDWGTGRIFDTYLQPFLAEHRVRGQQLCTKGLHNIILSWSTKSSRFAATRVFDKSDVPLGELFAAGGAWSRSSVTGSVANPANSKSSSKRLIADYLISQLYLVAEMCLGRNYPIIQSIEKAYPYEMLVSILRMRLSDELSGAAAYLLLCLYVDREPQTEIPLPRLTRTLTEVADSETSRGLVAVDKSLRGQFALLQVIIATHLEEIVESPLPAHTSNMVRLLEYLVKFNCYGSIEQMKIVLDLLMKCLRRGDFDLNEASDPTGISMSVKKLTAQSRSISRRSSTRVSSNKMQSPGSMNGGLVSEASNRSMLGTAQSGLSIIGKGESMDSFAALMLRKIDSLMAQYCLIILLLGTIILSAYFQVTGVDKGIQFIFEFAVFTVFLMEFLVSFILSVIVHHGVSQYLSKWYRLLDLVAVVLYAVAFIGNDSLIIFANLGRVTRFVTLLRVFVRIREAQKVADGVKDNVVSWTMPDRYFKTPDSSLDTLVQMVKVLYTIQTNVEDWRLTLALGRFSTWSQDPKSGADQIADIFSSVLSEASALSATSGDESDDTLVDLLMYHYPQLVQATLELLMTHHSSGRIFQDNLNKLQLITTQSGEAKYKRLEAIVNSLKRDADTHEIWGKLETPEHRRISSEVHKNLLDLTNECRKLRDVLRFDEKYEPIPFIQNILRNLGCFPVCMRISQLVLLIDKEETFKECNLNTRNLALTANRLLYWFVLDNPTNQSLAYSDLKFFIKSIDEKIDSHKVICAMFRNNLDLMESVPKKYIEEFIDMICNIGRFPQYLSLMASIINVGEKNVISNQYAVIKLMSSPENQKKIVQFFVPVSHPEYTKKLRLMSHYTQAVDVAVDELPSDLAYHLDLMGLLSSCTIGKSGMTTIEAKVQSMFNFVDVVDAMLDPQCLLLGKIRLGLFFYNAMLDVETPLPAVKDADCVWKILIAAQEIFSFAKDDLRSIEKNGWNNPNSCRQKIEYMLVNAMIVESYFASYYDHTIFKPEAGQVTPGVERVQIKEAQANNIIRNLFVQIQALYEMLSPALALEHHEVLYNALIALNNAAKEKLISQVENLHHAYFLAAKEYADDGAKSANKSFDVFLQGLNENAEVKGLVDGQIQGFIDKIEKLPWKSAVPAGLSITGAKMPDVRFEALIDRLVHHVRGCVQVILHGDDTIKFIEPNATRTCIWVLKIFRTMIENRWGMTIYERDDDGGEEQDCAVAELMKVYNDSQMSEMCLDLIAKGVDIGLQSEALKLLVGMLFKEGGALMIQKSIHNHLSQPGSDIFFRTVRQMLSNLMTWHKWNGVIALEPDSDPELPDELILVRCLQLMCEGHFRPNQDIMREQPNNNTSINLLDDFVLYLQTLDAIKCRTSTTAAMGVSATILEVIQGPCEGNQEYFALSTELIETLNRVIRQHPVGDCDEVQELELKKAAIDIFQALLEGQARKTAVYERMLSVIHVDVILVLCRGGDMIANLGAENAEESDESVELRTESLVLMQMLTDFRPSLKKELDIDDDFSNLSGDSVACIEVVWRGELQRRFFHIPDICAVLAKSTKDNFVLSVKRTSPEDKLYGLLEASKEMYREILHQQVLKSYRLDWIFCRTNQDRVIWCNFYVVCVINVLFVVYYSTESVDCADTGDTLVEYIDDTLLTKACTDVKIIDQNVDAVIVALNAVLIGGAVFALVSSLLVRAPVTFQYYREKGFNLIKSLFLTALNFSTIYYFLYLVIVVLGLVYRPLLSFLLLDFITMSPTTQGVLQAVFKPRRQIFMTLILTFIIVYIFAMYSFFFLNHNDFDDDQAMLTLGNSFRFLLRWALPYFSGVDYMTADIYSFRILDDLAFFLTCTVMLNILKGITIDTFVELRKGLETRMEDTTERCFICGIEKNTFNRTLDRDAFRNHIKHDQNLWNYIYFIIYLWEQDKDDDDGLESFVRRCIQENDLTWFPLNKAIRLAEFQEKGDVHSLKYRFRQDMLRSESVLTAKMGEFRDQVNRTLGRVEKSLEYEIEVDHKRATASRSTRNSALNVNSRASFARTALTSAEPNSARSVGSAGQAAARFSLSRGGHENTSSLLVSALEGPQGHPEGRRGNPHIGKLLAMGSSFNSHSGAPAGRSAASAMDADIMGQMHVRIVSLTGLILDPRLVPFVVVEVISSKHRGSVRPLTDLKEYNDEGLNPSHERGDAPSTPYSSEHMQMVASALRRSRSSFYMGPQMVQDAQQRARRIASGSSETDAEDAQPQDLSLDLDDGLLTSVVEDDTHSPSKPIQLMFDLIDNPAIIVHEGSLPRADLSKFIVKIQIRLIAGATAALLGAISVPFIDLLATAHAGRPVEVLFDQRSLDFVLPSDSRLLDFDDDHSHSDIRLRVPSRRGCIMSLSVIASHKLLEDFSLIS